MKYTYIIIYNYNKYSTFKDLKFACENSHQTSFSLRITVKWSMRAICKTSKKECQAANRCVIIFFAFI